MEIQGMNWAVFVQQKNSAFVAKGSIFDAKSLGLIFDAKGSIFTAKGSHTVTS
jgi:hypothetical protein